MFLLWANKKIRELGRERGREREGGRERKSRRGRGGREERRKVRKTHMY